MFTKSTLQKILGIFHIEEEEKQSQTQEFITNKGQSVDKPRKARKVS
jgi:hypothetical protein